MKVFGLIGEKLTHSLSPFIHKMFYETLGLNASYSLYQVQADKLQAAVQGVRALDISGVNVTIPYKIKIMDFLDNISPEASKIGAVNTILNKDNTLTGYNTDYTGFGRLLNKFNIEIQGKTAVVLGSGGAAKAVIAYLEDNGISNLYIITRNTEKITDFDARYKVLNYNELNFIDHSDLLINCTPIGMYPNIDESPTQQNIIKKFNSVVDLIYNPFCTKLMHQAKELEIPAHNGLYMLVSQAAAAVEIWNSTKIQDEIVDTVYQKLKEHMNK